jgi:hypothetical protein
MHLGLFASPSSPWDRAVYFSPILLLQFQGRARGEQKIALGKIRLRERQMDSHFCTPSNVAEPFLFCTAVL